MVTIPHALQFGVSWDAPHARECKVDLTSVALAALAPLGSGSETPPTEIPREPFKFRRQPVVRINETRLVTTAQLAQERVESGQATSLKMRGMHGDPGEFNNDSLNQFKTLKKVKKKLGYILWHDLVQRWGEDDGTNAFNNTGIPYSTSLQLSHGKEVVSREKMPNVG